MTSQLANALVECNSLEVLMALFNRHKKQIYVALILQLLTYQTSKHLNVASLFKLSQVSPQLHEITFKQIESIAGQPSDPKTDAQFEGFVGFMIDLCLKSTEAGIEGTRARIVAILANLAIRESHRSNLIQKGALELFMKILKQEIQTTKEVQRSAAKGLVNLVATKRDLRLKAITELSDQIQMIYRGELDQVVGTHLQTLLHK